MELLAFGKTGWGDELFYATLMTIAVSITAMLVGFLFALIFTPLKLSKYKTLNLVGNFYTTVIRGVPELLVIYLFFFAVFLLGLALATFFAGADFLPIKSSVINSIVLTISIFHSFISYRSNNPNNLLYCLFLTVKLLLKGRYSPQP